MGLFSFSLTVLRRLSTASFLLLLFSFVPVDEHCDKVDDGKLQEGSKDAEEANHDEDVECRQVADLWFTFSPKNRVWRCLKS